MAGARTRSPLPIAVSLPGALMLDFIEGPFWLKRSSIGVEDTGAAVLRHEQHVVGRLDSTAFHAG